MEFKGDYINGKFHSHKNSSGEWKSKSPADHDFSYGTVKYSYSHVDEVVSVAKEAFKKWKKVSLDERKTFLKKYQEVVKKRGDELAQVISLEMGKPLWESKTEISAMLGKVDITINESMKLVEETQFNEIMPGTLGRCDYRPLGVVAVVGPFNFPGHLPNGHIVPALLTGNTVIFKPSEKTPMTGQIMAECIHDAGFPEGVFNLIQGEKEVSRRLCVHEGISGILFTGSYEVGTRLKQDTLQQHWKMLALEMGGKNASIVWEDADIDVAIRENLIGSYITTGQRCSCTSRIFVHDKLYSQFVERFHQRAKSFDIGYPMDDVFMGPLIDRTSVDRYLKFISIAQREKFEILMRGKELELEKKGNYVTPTICLLPDPTAEKVSKSVFLQTEIFASSVAITRVKSMDEAIAYANDSQYGLVASVFTPNEKTFHSFSEELETGLINWNRATPGASSKLPFGGLKKSGNHRPTALLATQYCTYPVASLETPKPDSAAPSNPGLNWDK